MLNTDAFLICRNFGGTGLGLSICLQLVRLMHGEIHVDSTRDVGSTFTFNIRVKNGAAIAEPNANIDTRSAAITQLIADLGQPRILMVSPERVRLMVKSFVPWINDLDHRISVQDAISLAVNRSNEGKPYDCIIMDSPLPDGVNQMIAAITNSPALQNLRIILLIAPTVDNIRRHLANSSISTSSENGENEVVQSHHIFHPLVTRVSKPIRRIRLLNVLLKVLTESAASALVQQNASSVQRSSSGSATPIDNSKIGGPFEAGMATEIPSYSRLNQEGFSPEELAIFKGQKILVAEDNFIAQRLIVKQLAKLGFVVDKCNNGLECFDTWKQKGPDYYILAWIDHHMPKCDGLEATRMIRRYEKEMKYITALPIIALTADIQSTAQTNCINAGMNDYVTKPLMQKDLATILRKYCLGPTTV